MHVRKLPAFLASINPKKVRADLREKVILYQNECDDALWDYWTKGRAERKPEQPTSLPPTDAPITPDQQCTLQALVKARIEAIPEAERPKGRTHRSGHASRIIFVLPSTASSLRHA